MCSVVASVLQFSTAVKRPAEVQSVVLLGSGRGVCDDVGRSKLIM